MQNSSGLHLPSLGQLLVGGLGLLFNLCAGVIMLLLGLVTLAQSPTTAAPLLNLGWISIFICLLILPSIVLPVLRLMGKSLPAWNIRPRYIYFILLLLFWLPLLALGSWLSNQEKLAWLFLPPLQILVVGIPIWFFLETGRKNLPRLSHQRSWGVFDFEMLVTLPVILTVELLAMLFGGLGLFWLNQQPAVLDTLNQVGMRLINSNFNPEVVDRIARQTLQQPGVAYTILAVASGIIPLLEELFKPLVIWLFVHKKISPGEGFQIGLLSGSAFALLESLGSISTNPGNSWLVIAVGRSGTGLLHMLTAGLIGWGLALTWQDGKYLRLALAFLLAFCLHSIWNTTSLLVGLSPYLAGNGMIKSLGQIAPLALPILVITMFLILIKGNSLISKENTGENWQK
jgi:hypothetical protein